jgi:hypothetical protein
VKGYEKIYQADAPAPRMKQAGVAILTSDKVDIKPKLVKRDKEGHFILIKMWYIHTIESYLTFKKKEILPHATQYS